MQYLKNVKPELEVFDNGMINASKYFIDKGLIKPPYYYNLMICNLFTAQDTLNDITSMINNLPNNSIFSLAPCVKTIKLYKSNSVTIFIFYEIYNFYDFSHKELGGIGNCQMRVNHLSLLYADGVRVCLEDFIYKNEDREELVSNYYLVKRLVDFCNNNNNDIGIFSDSKRGKRKIKFTNEKN